MATEFVGSVGWAGDNLTKNINYKCLVFLMSPKTLTKYVGENVTAPLSPRNPENRLSEATS